MRQLLKTQILDALKESLRDLETLKLVSAGDPHVADLKRHLRAKISELEKDTTTDQHVEMAA